MYKSSLNFRDFSLRKVSLALLFVCCVLSLPACRSKESSEVKATPAATTASKSSAPGTTGKSPTASPERALASEPDLASQSASRFLFSNEAIARQVEFAYRNGEEAGHCAIIENLGGGIGVIDFDNNGWPDLLVAGGGTIAADQSISGLDFGLFQNNGGLFTNAQQPSRFEPHPRYSHGVTIADLDNDGFDDAIVSGYGGVSIMLNMGDGSFQDASFSLPEISGIVTSVAAGDINGDAMPDLYCTTYVDWSFENHPQCTAPSGNIRELCSPKEFSGTPDRLFVSAGDGTFLDFDSASGMRKDGKGLGVLMFDVDRDGDNDLYVANDTTENFLYLNDGSGKLSEVGISTGVAFDERALPNGSMGLTACDINQDLHLDIWVANYERESFALYRNEGNAQFLHTSRRYGISALGGMYVGFGTDWEDFDLDGKDEIVVTNGHVLKFPTGTPRRQRPLLLARDDSRFEVQEFDKTSYFAHSYEGRGLAIADLNGDNLSDVVISHINENVAVLINQTPPAGGVLKVRLIGTRSSRNAVGAHLILETSSGKVLQTLAGGGSYLSQSERIVRFGLGQETAATLEIHWPSGTVQTHDDLQGIEQLDVIEPAEAFDN